MHHVSFDIDFRKNTYPGKFIVLEGIEGSGKSTQVKKLSEILSKTEKVFITKNPTDGEIGSYIRNEILTGSKKHIPPVSYQYLFAADRVIQQEQVSEHLRSGDTVISDRYFWSSVAYGIADRKGTDFENWEEVSLIALSILSMYYQFILPDLSIYLDISLDESLKRISGSVKHTEIYDTHETNIEVKKGYDWLIKKFPKEIIRVNAEKPADKVAEEILKLIGGVRG